MAVGRFLCVSLPFLLTAVSLVALLIVGLAGITSSSLPLFTITTKDLSISISDLSSLTSVNARSLSALTEAATAGLTTNITATDLGLADSYSFALWNFVATTGSVSVKSAAKFNYAANITNTSSITTLAAANGITLATPTAITDALKTFATLVEWTEIVFIVACVLTGVTLLFGLISFCSRIGSCCTFLVSGVSTLAIIAFAALGTVLGSTIVGTLQIGRRYGITSSLNTTWLVIAWLAAAASLAAGLFWMFTICCCSPEHRARREKHHSTAGGFEKPYGGYSRVHDPLVPYPGQESGTYSIPQQSYPMSNVKAHTGAYEPYSHQAV